MRRQNCGHYCKACGAYKANEKFSGKDHAAYICKACAGLTTEKQAEGMTLNRIFNLPWRLSKADLAWLRNRAKDKRPEIKALAQEHLAMCFPLRQQCIAKGENEKMEWFEELKQDELSFTMETLTEKTKSGALRGLHGGRIVGSL